MDDLNSLAYIADFQRRIKAAPADRTHEQFIRGLLSDIALDCPMSVLIEVATCVLNIRKAELRTAGESN